MKKFKKSLKNAPATPAIKENLRWPGLITEQIAELLDFFSNLFKTGKELI